MFSLDLFRHKKLLKTQPDGGGGLLGGTSVANGTDTVNRSSCGTWHTQTMHSVNSVSLHNEAVCSMHSLIKSLL